jgi:hypothetical protein
MTANSKWASQLRAEAEAEEPNSQEDPFKLTPGEKADMPGWLKYAARWRVKKLGGKAVSLTERTLGQRPGCVSARTERRSSGCCSVLQKMTSCGLSLRLFAKKTRSGNGS